MKKILTWGLVLVISGWFGNSFARSVHASEQRTQTEPAEKNRDSNRLERFEKQVEDLRTQLKIPGLSAIILKGQKVLWTKGFGLTDVERRVPATAETLYHVESLTKLFAATLILQMVEQGKLDLEEPGQLQGFQTKLISSP